jgi:hypothetical protein
MTMNSPRPNRMFGALAFAVFFVALVAVAIGGSWQRIARASRQEVAREAELDDSSATTL